MAGYSTKADTVCIRKIFYHTILLSFIYFLFLNKIGSGSYGNVYKAYARDLGEFIAVKSISLENEYEREKVETEI